MLTIVVVTNMSSKKRFSNFKRLFGFGDFSISSQINNDASHDETEERNKRRKIVLHSVQRNKDPEDVWKIVGVLGDGAYGKVYKAENRQTGVAAAAKVCQLGEEEEIDDFIVEIDILSLRHKNLVALHEAFFFKDKLWMLIELCSVGAVDQIMHKLERPLEENELRYIGREVLVALEFLHRSCVIHRDLKAGNILLTRDAVVKVADFGVSAKNLHYTQSHDSFIGTSVYWMAPEIMRCETFRDMPYDYRSEIWSFGITLIEMAQMEPPNNEMSPMQVLIKIQKSDPPRLAQPNLWTPCFSDVLTHCLQKEPRSRSNVTDLLVHPFFDHAIASDKAVRLLISEITTVISVPVTTANASNVGDTRSASNSVSSASMTSVQQVLPANAAHAAVDSNRPLHAAKTSTMPRSAQNRDSLTLTAQPTMSSFVNSNDVCKMITRQTHILGRLEKANELMGTCGMIYSNRLPVLDADLQRQVRVLQEVKRGLDSIFQRIRLVKQRIAKLHPDQFREMNELAAVRAECDDDTDSGDER